MSEKVVIDIEARFTDNTGSVRNAQKNIDELNRSADKAQKSLNDLGKTNAKPRVDADDSGFTKKMKSVEDKAKKFGQLKAEGKLSVLDRASEYIDRAASKAKAFAGKAYNAYLRIKDSDAMKSIGNIAGGLKSLVGKSWRVTVGLVDKVTAPIRSVAGKLNSVLGLAGAGISAYGLVVKPIQLEADYQDLNSQFEVLLGSASAAQKRVDELTAFAGQTPFTRDQIYNASKMLEVYSPAISTPDAPGGLKMVGDIAAGTGRDYNEVAMWVGRLYSALEGGRPVGEMAAALQEMGAIGGVARNKLEKLAESGKDVKTIWPQVTEQFSRFDGTMEKQADNLNNLLLGVKSFATNNFLKKIGAGISESLTPALKKFREWRSENKGLISEWAEGVQNFATTISGKVINGVENLAKKFQTLFQSDEFKQADGFFGKLKVAWDKIIGEPLSNWWNGPGQAKMVDVSNKIGKFLGEGITAAILGIFGVKTDLLGEGMNVAGSFVDGFKKGFEGAEIGSAIWGGIKRFFVAHPVISLILGGLGVGKLIGAVTSGLGAASAGTGTAGLGGLAATIANVATIWDGLKGVTGSAAAGKLGSFVTSNVVGTAAAGTPAAAAAGGAGAALGSRVITGGLFKGKEISAGMASGLGLAATAGGIAAGASVISGANDLYNGYKADNEYDKKYNYAKGGTTLGGVAAGAAIGSILPGVGTLIGAGVGGLVGWISSGKVAESFAGGAEGAEKYAKSSSLAAQKTGELKQKQAELAKSTLDKKFGDITLSAEDMNRAVTNLFGADKLNAISKNDAAISKMSESWAAMNDAGATLDKSMWLATIKPNETKLAADEIENLKASTKSYGDSAKTFLTDAQYAAESSISLLMGSSKKAKELVDSTRNYYGGQSDELSKKTSELNKEMAKDLKDGVISVDEQASIDNIRGQIDKITQEIANQQWEADLNILEAKAGNGKDISEESFEALVKEAHAKGEEAAKSYWDAYGTASVGKSEKQKKELLAGTLGKVGELQLDEGNLGLGTLKEKFSNELGAFNTDMQSIIDGKVSFQDMSQALSDAMSSADWSGTKASIGTFLDTMQPAIEGVKQTYSQLQELEAGGIDVPDKVMGGLKNFLGEIGKLEVTQADNPLQALQSWLDSQEIEWNPTVNAGEPQIKGGQKTKVDGSQVVDTETTPVNVETPVKANAVPIPGLAPLDVSKLLPAKELEPVTVDAPIKANFVPLPGNQLNGNQLIANRATGTTTMTANVIGKAKVTKKAKVNSAQLVNKSASGKATVKANITGKKGSVKKAKVKGSDIAPKSVPHTVTAKITGKKAIQNKISVSAADFSIPESVSKTVTVNVSGVANVTGTHQFRGGIVGSGKIKGFAGGGFVQGGTQLATLAEEGTPEAIIPLGAHRRKRALELYARVGKELGVPRYAAGGIAGGSIRSGATTGGNISIGGVTLNVYAQGGQSVLDAIKDQKEELADELAGIINDGLNAQFENTPARG
ncbi:hypothetical protein OBO34_19600 [Clostridiales Family XIII bacterium ASD5510]|uniref:Tape measure protein n=1 Tax=Hominibacterium faecale TaxID=2839743 RepID=A0A9J6QYE7_9FIRM|nr:hypothetical protein [Hominibacterium faecale]MCU7380521.1 hypothetical protein [Hominibacterium faecale]